MGKYHFYTITRERHWKMVEADTLGQAYEEYLEDMGEYMSTESTVLDGVYTGEDADEEVDMSKLDL